MKLRLPIQTGNIEKYQAILDKMVWLNGNPVGHKIGDLLKLSATQIKSFGYGYKNRKEFDFDLIKKIYEATQENLEIDV